MFKHFLLCRYNLGLYTDNPYKIECPSVWMEERLPMFKRLLKSLQDQTNSNFALIVSLDAFTPLRYTGEIAQVLVNSGLDFVLIYRDPREAIPSVSKEAEWLITTRIDNDDEYRPEFIEAIQSSFREETEVLDVFGVQFDGEKYYTSGRPTPNSPFISLVEKWNDPKTVLHRPHSIMNGEYLARWASKEALYIQHIHNSNAANKIIGRPIQKPWT